MKNKIIILGGSGKMGNEIIKHLKKRYTMINFSLENNKLINKKNYYNLNLGSKKNIEQFFEKKINLRYLIGIINCLRVRFDDKDDNFEVLNKTYEILIKNYFYFIDKLITKYKLKNLSIINFSSTNTELISHQSFSYHYSKSVLENLTKYMSIKYLKKNIKVNNLQIGLIKTKDLNKIINVRNLKKNLSLKNIANYKDIIMFMESALINNQILNGTTIKVDGSLTNIDQLHFANLINK